MTYDIAIIGGGVTGCAVARELSKFDARVCLLEREADLCEGTSKANSAIIHAGFDAVTGSMKAKMNVEGNRLMDDLAKDLDFPFLRNGSLVVCTKGQDAALLDELKARGKANGMPELRILDREELLAMEPNIADDVVKALYAPTGAIVCPFNMTYALAENAAENGVEFLLDTEVTDIQKRDDGYVLSARRGVGTTSATAKTEAATADEAERDNLTISAKVIVNAAGVYADVFNNMVSTKKIHITARRGQYMLLDKTAGNHVSHTIFQLPGKMGKGVLVTPTVHGNLLIGPTAEDIENKEGVNTTGDGLYAVSERSALSVKNLPYRAVITSFAGLRAHEDGDDFILGEAENADGFFNAAGMESPGLSSAPAVGAYLANEIAGKLNLSEKTDFKRTRKGIVNPANLSLEERNELIKQNPAYGQIICRCESISEGEILDAIHRPLGATTLDGVKRRTRAGMGRCQAGFCSPRVMEILERELGISMFDVQKSGDRSKIVVGFDKETLAE